MKKIITQLVFGLLILSNNAAFAQSSNSLKEVEILEQRISTIEYENNLLEQNIQMIEQKSIKQNELFEEKKESIEKLLESKTKTIEEQAKSIKQDSEKSTKNLNYVWILICASLVFFMQAGFALVESGTSRSKNMVNVLMKNYMDMAVGTIAFSVIGFGLMFGASKTGFLGTSHFLFNNFKAEDYIMFFFQLMFASTAATIVSGAIAERTRFIGYLIGAIIICAFIYPIFGAWSWGSLYEGTGWLKKLGFIDFAGSTVVHVIGGVCALAATMVVGPRLGRFGKNGQTFEIPSHNASLIALGTFILWFGWFGFNGGSLLEANDNLGVILINTHIAAAAGAIGAMLIQTIYKEKILMTVVLNGGLGGLVGITAGAASMSPFFAIITGFLSGVFMYLASKTLLKFKIDDVVNAFPVHGICGIWGTLAAGIFFKDDLFNIQKIGIQLLGVSVAIIWAFIVGYIVYYLLNSFGMLRVPTEDERAGLDYTEHAELGYPEFQKEQLFNNQK